MIKERKKIRKLFIEATLGSKKYFSYRTDVMLIKVFISSIFLFVMYLTTFDLIFSLIIAAEAFAIFTLINKLILERKEKEGKKILLNKVKLEYFYKKIINEMSMEDYENFIKFLLEKEGYSNFKKIAKYCYIVNKNELYCVKSFKLHENAEVEKLDIRSYLTVMTENKIKKGILITINEISDEAKKLLENIKNIEIEIIDRKKLYDYAEKNNILPEEKFFYDKLLDEKNEIFKKTKIYKNTFNSKKILIYIFASILFFALSKIMPYNSMYTTISWYFIILAIISLSYSLFVKFNNHNS